MTLAEYSTEQIGRWEDLLLEAAGELKKIRDGMADDDLETVSLEATKASTYIDYLLPWAIQAEARFRQFRARQSAATTRTQVKKKRKKRS
ncbi:MAG: hypothetical protein RIC55_28305 [Pirellulaceae bacterium]